MTARRQLTPEQMRDMIKQYDSGMSCREIAEATGYSQSYIKNTLRGYGVTLRPRGGYRRRETKTT